MYQIVFRRLLIYGGGLEQDLPRASQDVKAVAWKLISGKPKCEVHTIGPKIVIDMGCNIDPCRRPQFYINGCQVLKTLE